MDSTGTAEMGAGQSSMCRLDANRLGKSSDADVVGSGEYRNIIGTFNNLKILCYCNAQSSTTLCNLIQHHMQLDLRLEASDGARSATDTQKLQIW